MEPHITFIAMELQLIIAKGVCGTNTKIFTLKVNEATNLVFQPFGEVKMYGFNC
jgi:hypothetical protein